MSLSIQVAPNPSSSDMGRIAPRKQKQPKKMVLSLDQFQAWDGGNIRNVSQPLTSSALLDELDPAIAAERPNPKNFYSKYNGKISGLTRRPQYVYINDVADKLYFSQTNVSDFNKGEKADLPLDFLADAMFIEFKKDINKPDDGALDVVDMGGGIFTSIDNRRLLLAKKIGMIDRTYGIWIRVHQANDVLSRGLQQRFDGARTWGAAVNGRINSKDEHCKGYQALPIIKTTNSSGFRVNALDQTIPLCVDCDLSALNIDDAANIRRLQKGNMIRI